MIEAVVIGLILVKFSGGNYNNIKNFKFTDLKGYKFILAGIVTIILSGFFVRGVVFKNESFIKFFVINFNYLHILSLFLIMLGLLLNYKNSGIFLMGIGILLNIIPVVVNGKMPVDYNALLKVGESTNSSSVHININALENNFSLTHGLFENPKCRILSDIIPIPSPYYSPKVISIGDILVMIGLIVAILSISRREK